MGSEMEIGLTLFQHEAKLRATYFYRKHLKDVPLSGQYLGGRDVTLEEQDSSGKVPGHFRLRFMETDPELKSDKPLTVDVLDGDWTGEDGKTTFPVKLRLAHSCIALGSGRYVYGDAANDELVEKNVQGFYFAVLRGDKEEVAKYARFPLSFSINNKPRTASNRTAFLRYYDAIFTKSFVEKIAKGVPHHMFANWQGIMLGDGEVWFDENGKARHFNN